MKCRLIGKDPEAGKDRRQEKGMIEDEMVGWHHRLNGHEFEQDAGDMGLIPGSERYPGGENGNPLQYSCMENLMDRGAW